MPGVPVVVNPLTLTYKAFQLSVLFILLGGLNGLSNKLKSIIGTYSTISCIVRYGEPKQTYR